MRGAILPLPNTSSWRGAYQEITDIGNFFLNFDAVPVPCHEVSEMRGNVL
jgi:hypothetical protein